MRVARKEKSYSKEESYQKRGVWFNGKGRIYKEFGQEGRTFKKGRAASESKRLIEDRRDCLKEKSFRKRGTAGLKAKTCLD